MKDSIDTMKNKCILGTSLIAFILMCINTAIAQNDTLVFNDSISPAELYIDLNAKTGFGYSVDIDGDFAIVGAKDYPLDQNEENSLHWTGAAFILKKNSNGNWVKHQVLTPPTRKASDNAGFSVAISGNYAFIGAPFRSDQIIQSLYNRGGVFIFERNSQDEWIYKQTIEGPTNLTYKFGFDVAADGNLLVVGSPEESLIDPMNSNYLNGIVPRAGVARIYKKSITGIWEPHAFLKANDIKANVKFGTSVDIEGNIVVVGAPVQNNGSSTLTAVGAAYVFSPNYLGNWTQTQKITSTPQVQNQHFGTDVSLSGNNLLIGAPFGKNPDFLPDLKQTGEAFMFSLNNSMWTQTSRLYPSEDENSINFGAKVSLNGNKALISGGVNFPILNEKKGIVYLFKEQSPNTWLETQKINQNEKFYNATFIHSVALGNNTAIIGSYLSDLTLYNRGVVRTYNVNLDIYSVHSDTICKGDSSLFENVYHTEPGSYSYVHTASNGEDSTVIFNVFEYPHYDTIVYDTIVPYGYYDFGGQILRSEGTYTHVFTSKYGCDSIVHLHLDEIDATLSTQFSQKIVSNDRDKFDDFGNAVAIDGDYAVVGAWREDNDHTPYNYKEVAGSAYIFKKDANGNWIQHQKIIASDREPYDHFGQSVTISNDLIAIGAYTKGPNKEGAVYIFQKQTNDTWVQIQKLMAPPALQNFEAKYGWKVKIHNQFLWIAAPDQNITTDNGTLKYKAGAVYSYRFNSNANVYTYQELLTASDVEGWDRFGYSIDMDDNYSVIGAYFKDYNTNGTYIGDGGAVYVYQKHGSNWQEWTILSSPEINTANYFGSDVAIDGDEIIVGAFGEDENLIGTGTLEKSGAAYIFEKQSIASWIYKQKLEGFDREFDDRFGTTVDIKNGKAIVGAWGEDKDPLVGSSQLNRAGAAYLFEKSSQRKWVVAQKITAPIRHEDEFFAKSLALTDTEIMIGAMQEYEDENNLNTKKRAGAVYFYNISTTPFAKTAFDNDNTTRIEELSNTVKAFPNPIENQLTIQLDNVADKIDIQVINLNGQVVEQLSIENQSQVQLQLEHLTAGVYIVKVNTDITNHVIQVIKN